jgi:hypothetical protein
MVDVHTPQTAALPGVQVAPGWRLRLATDWKELKTKATVLFSTFMAAVSILGPQLRDSWAAIPDDLKLVIPANVKTGISYAIVFLLMIAFRYGRLEKTPKEGTDAAN